MPHDTSTDAACGLSAWGAGHSGGGAIANTWSSLRFARPGVTGRLTNTAHPEVAPTAATPANSNGTNSLRISMAPQNNRIAPGGANRVRCAA